jgi:hypothetical protein
VPHLRDSLIVAKVGIHQKREPLVRAPPKSRIAPAILNLQ